MATAVAQPHRRHTKRIVAAIVVVVLVLVAGTATFLGMHRMLPWQSIPVPTLDQLASKQGTSVDSLTADQVEQELKSEGFQTSRSQQYSGKSAGAFLAFSNVSEGQQLRHGSLIDIIESLGPGVPSGTVGTQATDSKQALADMNVPVTYRAVVTSVPGSSFSPAGTDSGSTGTDAGSAGSSASPTDPSAATPGTVVATYPADGQPVTDTGKGITVAVATQSDAGIPLDYYGQDPDAVQADLESRGYTVTRKAKFSTKANVGKVVASDPALGTAAATGAKVTLYYGVDSSSTHDVFTNIYQPTTGASDGPEAAQGTYCRKDGDCITLSKDCSGSYCELYSSQAPKSSSTTGASTALQTCFGAQASCLPNTKDEWQTITSTYSYQAQDLIYGSTGTFELTTDRQLRDATCETDWDTQIGGSGPGDTVTRCVDDKLQSYPSSQSQIPADNPSYQMDDVWYVYVPVGADIASVAKAGYFDADAMNDAASQGEPDSGTPYFVARDPSLYDETKIHMADVTNLDEYKQGPFVPFLGNSSRLAVKPAPSAQSAYYLVENPVDPNNLGAFPETDIDDLNSSDESTSEPSESAQPSPSATSSESSASPSASPSATPKTYTPDEVKAAVGSGDFTPIAGTYCAKYSQTPGSCYTIDASGNITLSDDYDNRGTEQLKTTVDDWQDMNGNSTMLYLSGLDSYGGCKTSSGVDHSNFDCSNANTVWPYQILYCPDPAAIDWTSLGAMSVPKENVPFVRPAPQGASQDYTNWGDYFNYAYYKVS
ncbi:PASTA domain-containing protein [Pseudoscardovia radai]|uniref:PASTA domain-containing protein n=1 Tax=Pseudoscardovia radai TaxID=987066 RepID=UPI0039920BD4